MNKRQLWFDAIVEFWTWLANKPFLAACVLALLTVACAWCVALVVGLPEPQVHDELTQVAMADIFAHGRLCEPSSRFWRHFEAIHVLSQPCYQGKYPPGLALFMAIGDLLFGQPIAGVWIADVLMVATAAYAMYAWLPPFWALVGATLIAMRFGIVGHWAQAYWGGAVAAAGGALVIGGVRWLVRTPSARHGAATGVGIVLLALSRPYEGLALLIAVAALQWKPASRALRGREFLRSAFVVLAIVSAGLAWMGYYNYRVTGSPLTLPYSLYETYAHRAASIHLAAVPPRAAAPAPCGHATIRKGYGNRAGGHETTISAWQSAGSDRVVVGHRDASLRAGVGGFDLDASAATTVSKGRLADRAGGLCLELPQLVDGIPVPGSGNGRRLHVECHRLRRAERSLRPFEKRLASSPDTRRGGRLYVGGRGEIPSPAAGRDHLVAIKKSNQVATPGARGWGSGLRALRAASQSTQQLGLQRRKPGCPAHYLGTRNRLVVRSRVAFALPRSTGMDCLRGRSTGTIDPVDRRRPIGSVTPG